jgi:hypothetical protein
MDGFENTDIDLKLSQNLRLGFYGWSEIEGIAKKSSQQLDLIDSFISGIGQLKTDEQGAIGKLEANAVLGKLAAKRHTRHKKINNLLTFALLVPLVVICGWVLSL